MSSFLVPKKIILVVDSEPQGTEKAVFTTICRLAAGKTKLNDG